jgi:hypothetical protein
VCTHHKKHVWKKSSKCDETHPNSVVSCLQKVGSRRPHYKVRLCWDRWLQINWPADQMDDLYTNRNKTHTLSLSSLVPDTIDCDIAPTNTLGWCNRTTIRHIMSKSEQVIHTRFGRKIIEGRISSIISH